MSGHPTGRGQDPTLVRNQPALRSARRRIWLIPAAILAAIGVAMLAATLTIAMVAPIVGIALIVGLYAAMCLVADSVRDARRRNIAFAWLMVGLAVVPVVALALVVLTVRASA